MALQRQLFAALHNWQKANGGYLAGLTALLILPNRLALMGKKCKVRLGLGALMP
jgi:hypothetical protein